MWPRILDRFGKKQGRLTGRGIVIVGAFVSLLAVGIGLLWR